MSDEKKPDVTKSDSRHIELAEGNVITLGEDDAAIVCKGESIELYFPNRDADVPIGSNDLLCLALAGIIAHQPKVLLAELDRIDAMDIDVDETVTSDTLKPDVIDCPKEDIDGPPSDTECPNCAGVDTYCDATDEDGNEAWLCEECHEGWDVDDDGVLIRQDTPSE